MEIGKFFFKKQVLESLTMTNEILDRKNSVVFRFSWFNNVWEILSGGVLSKEQGGLLHIMLLKTIAKLAIGHIMALTRRAKAPPPGPKRNTLHFIVKTL